MRGVSRHAFDAGLALQHITRGTGEVDGGPCWVKPLLRAAGTILRGAEAMARLELFHCKAGRQQSRCQVLILLEVPLLPTVHSQRHLGALSLHLGLPACRSWQVRMALPVSTKPWSQTYCTVAPTGNLGLDMRRRLCSTSPGSWQDVTADGEGKQGRLSVWGDSAVRRSAFKESTEPRV
jgi:hypothetical protein